MFGKEKEILFNYGYYDAGNFIPRVKTIEEAVNDLIKQKKMTLDDINKEIPKYTAKNLTDAEIIVNKLLKIMKNVYPGRAFCNSDGYEKLQGAESDKYFNFKFINVSIGGNLSIIDNAFHKQKYLKYKYKYLNLKNQ